MHNLNNPKGTDGQRVDLQDERVIGNGVLQWLGRSLHAKLLLAAMAITGAGGGCADGQIEEPRAAEGRLGEEGWWRLLGDEETRLEVEELLERLDAEEGEGQWTTAEFLERLDAEKGQLKTVKLLKLLDVEGTRSEAEETRLDLKEWLESEIRSNEAWRGLDALTCYEIWETLFYINKFTLTRDPIQITEKTNGPCFVEETMNRLIGLQEAAENGTSTDPTELKQALGNIMLVINLAKRWGATELKKTPHFAVKRILDITGMSVDGFIVTLKTIKDNCPLSSDDKTDVDSLLSMEGELRLLPTTIPESF